MKVILIDDEKLAIDSLKLVLQRIGQVQIIGTYTNPMEALESLCDGEVEAVFLDNEMGKYNGIQIAKEIKRKHPEIHIVFVTAYKEFAIEAFEIRAVDYLLKPVTETRLRETLARLTENSKQEHGSTQIDHPKLIVNVMGNGKLYDNKGVEAKWRTRKVKELFFYLWHHYPSAVHRTRILEDLWSEQYKDNATQLMHTTLYQLRKVLRNAGFKKPVKLVNEKYMLDVDMESDLEKMEELLSLPVFTKVEIEELLQIYQGDYMEEESYTWANAKQHQLKATFLTTLETYIHEQMKNGKETLLMELCLDKMIAFEPYNDRYIYTVIDYYGKKKDLKTVIKATEKFKEIWSRELGIDIPKEITMIYEKYTHQIKNDAK